jgi:hypothetical protein
VDGAAVTEFPLTAAAYVPLIVSLNKQSVSWNLAEIDEILKFNAVFPEKTHRIKSHP